MCNKKAGKVSFGEGEGGGVLSRYTFLSSQREREWRVTLSVAEYTMEGKEKLNNYI